MKRFLAVAVVGALALASGACFNWPTKPDVSQDVNVNVNINTPSPAPSASPSPSPSPSTAAVAHVKVSQFGETCPSGTLPGPADRDVRVGCTISLTCSPTDASGRDVGGPSLPPTFGEVGTSGNVESRIGSDAAGNPNPYNLAVKGVRAGTATFDCTVGGRQSDAPFVLTVIP